MPISPVDRARLMRRRSDIVTALAAVKDDPTGTGPSVVAQCMNVVADELQQLIDEIAPETVCNDPHPDRPDVRCSEYPGPHRGGFHIYNGPEGSHAWPQDAPAFDKPQGPVAVQQPGFGAS